MKDGTNSEAQVVSRLYDVPAIIPPPPYGALELLAAAVLEGRVKVDVSYGWTGETRSVTSYKIVVYPGDK